MSLQLGNHDSDTQRGAYTIEAVLDANEKSTQGGSMGGKKVVDPPKSLYGVFMSYNGVLRRHTV